ncbi:MAG TPA: hypothetical protein VKR41_01805, partial [Puia sp.]|nr:hypothetical protein [Puia sp.]
MKRVLFVGAGKEFPQGAFRFLQSLPDDHEISVTGLFFCTIDYEAFNTVSQLPILAPYDRLHELELDKLQGNKAVFARKCGDCQLKFQLHPNEEIWDSHLFARESRFSDLVVLSGEQFYGEVDPSQPNVYLREALHAAECPVMIVPENYSAPQHLVIAYDGSRDSLHALKQFTYLFPEYTDLATEIVYVKDDNSADMPDKDLLSYFSGLHFSSMNLSRLHFRAARYFAAWIGEKQHVMLVG